MADYPEERVVVAARHRVLKQLKRHFHVLLDASSLRKQYAEIMRRAAVAVHRRLLIPRLGLFGHRALETLSFGKHESQTELRVGILLLRYK